MNNVEGDSILLNSGTNEVEIVEFGIKNSVFGINVIKVKEIINAQKTVEIPLSHPDMEGIMQLRGDIIPLINLGNFLKYEPSASPKNDKYIVTEFNKGIYAFRVHSVSRIHRISWEMIEKPTELSQNEQNCVLGVIRLEGRMILLLDFERILMEIAPALAMPDLPHDSIDISASAGKHIVIAEDSSMLRKLLMDYLSEIGYQKITFFQNGQEAWSYLLDTANNYGERFFEEVSLLITDIEMPLMDGHFLTRSVKEHPILKKLPVIIFSSLITEQLKHKGDLVGANAQVSKPEYNTLAQIINQCIV